MGTGAASASSSRKHELGPLFGAAIAALRIWFGIVFLLNGLAKFVPGIAHTSIGFLIDLPGAKGILTFYAHRNPVIPYRNLVDQVILPNWNILGPAEAVAEVVVGVLLILGLFATLAALVGALLQLHLQFASLWTNQWVFEYSVEWVPLLVLAAVHAGRWYGVDGRRHWSGWIG